jgi:hypothetical protein
MATVTVARSDLWPIGTTVSIYPAGARNAGAPAAAAIASAAVDAAGLLTVTSGSILSLTPYVAAAQVGGEWRYAIVRSTADVYDRGVAVGTGDLTSGLTTLTNVSASSGAFAVGQRINGTGIPSGTRLISGSGASWVLSTKATASGTGVALVADGARVPAANLGATAVPSRYSTPWGAQLMQRRSIAGTS